MSFRDAAQRLSPARLMTYRAVRKVYAFIGLPLDMIAQAVTDSVRARFPEQCPEDALPYHGRDRGIRRGPLEPKENYIKRLLLWIEAWRQAGVGRGMLDQIAGYLSPKTTRIRIWTQTGVVYTRDAAGVFSVQRVSSSLWNWDGQTSLWSRFWVIIDSVGGVPWSRDGTWNDGERWGESNTLTWGSTATISDVQSIKAIVADWKPAASVCKDIIISFDAAAFSTSDTSPPLPDGNWAIYSKNVGGVQVPARDARGIYWGGVA